ncbi:hypothetical protein [Streptomyces sp. NPDC088726]|uniref:hypothetical protein n=1 Tax=Streptomyces sp. NPDC088726 TaxID=3365874 RepID=UPI0038270024
MSSTDLLLPHRTHQSCLNESRQPDPHLWKAPLVTILILPFAGLVLGVLGPLLATTVAVLSPDPIRRADARKILHLLLTRTKHRRNQPENAPVPPSISRPDGP